MRRIAVVTVGRSDYGIYRPILRRLAVAPGSELLLVVSGAHFEERFGCTVGEIEADGFPIAARLPLPVADDRPESVAIAMGRGTAQYGESFARLRPDLLLVLGDRFEMHAAAVAALPLGLPVAHVHGGELTFGAIDDALRHSITKLSHLHFPATEESATRLRQMGEEAWRITVSGAPALDNLAEIRLASLADFAARHRLPLSAPPLLVTFHPVTLQHGSTAAHFAELLAALRMFDEPILFTLPNTDTEHRTIIDAIHAFTGTTGNAFAVANLGTTDYFSAMSWARAMVGNSSSGIIEAASFALPVVNVGDRQAGRMHGANVIDCPQDREAVAAAIRTALSAEFRASLAGLRNPYGDGHATERIVSRLLEVELGSTLLTKRFADLPAAR